VENATGKVVLLLHAFPESDVEPSAVNSVCALLLQCSAALSLQVVSQVENATGKVVLLPDLLGVQGVAFEQPTVVLAQSLGGMEDIPDGVVAVLTRSSTDVLSHVAIRARTQGVLLAGCSDEEEWRHLVELEVGVTGHACSGWWFFVVWSAEGDVSSR
jgi:hypothetical protein